MKQTILNFIICVLLTVAVERLVAPFPMDGISLWILGWLWAPVVLCWYVVIYFVYYAISVYLMKEPTRHYATVWILLIVGVFYSIMVILIDVNYRQDDRVFGFAAYLKLFSNYMVFTIISVVQISGSVIRKYFPVLLRSGRYKWVGRRDRGPGG